MAMIKSERRNFHSLAATIEAGICIAEWDGVGVDADAELTHRAEFD